MFDAQKMLISSLRKISIHQNTFFHNANFENCKAVVLYGDVKCAYNRIKKSANSSTLMFMADALAANGYKQQLSIDEKYQLDYKDYKNKSRKYGISLCKVWRPSQIDELQDYFWFTVVRNPYTRLLSAFLQKGLAAQQGNSIFRGIPGFDRLDPAGFKDFVSFLEDGGLYANAHWKPQNNLLFMPPERFNYIAKTEVLASDMEYIFQEIGLKNTQSTNFSQPHVAEASSEWKITNASSRAAEFYDQNICERVYDLYRTDFIKFGYNFDEFQ